jgi:hypothetical protein
LRLKLSLQIIVIAFYKFISVYKVNRVHLSTKFKVHGLFIQRDMNQLTSKVVTGVRIDKGIVTTVRAAGKTKEHMMKFILKTIPSKAPIHILKT